MVVVIAGMIGVIRTHEFRRYSRCSNNSATSAELYIFVFLNRCLALRFVGNNMQLPVTAGNNTFFVLSRETQVRQNCWSNQEKLGTVVARNKQPSMGCLWFYLKFLVLIRKVFLTYWMVYFSI